MFIPFQALDAARAEAQSALPNAPVVEHVPAKPRRARSLRRPLARALYALARVVDGENRAPYSARAAGPKPC